MEESLKILKNLRDRYGTVMKKYLEVYGVNDSVNE